MKIIKIIPFRLQSQRFPDKALSLYRGVPLICNSIDIANAIRYGSTVVSAPLEDYERAAAAVDIRNRKHEYTPSGVRCACATDRIVEIYERFDADIYISIPMDEAALDPREIERIIESLDDDVELLTLYCDFYSRDDAVSRLSAKMVTDGQGRVLYMSRAVIPVPKEGDFELSRLKKNVGVFFFRRRFLDILKKSSITGTQLDLFEGLEQLRWLELGYVLHAKKIAHYGFGIDVPEQIQVLEERLRCIQEQKK